MSETIKVGQVWRDYSGDYLIVGGGDGVWAAVMPKTGVDNITLHGAFFDEARLIPDAPAPTPAAEKPEVGRWYMLNGNQRWFYVKSVDGIMVNLIRIASPGEDGHETRRSAAWFSWNCTPCDPPAWADEALARAGIVPTVDAPVTNGMPVWALEAAESMGQALRKSQDEIAAQVMADAERVMASDQARERTGEQLWAALGEPTTTWHMPKGTGVTWQTRTTVPTLPLNYVEKAEGKILKINDDGTASPYKPAPREVHTCIRCGLRFEAVSARDRCDVCHEQHEKRRAAEAFADTNRALDVAAAVWMRGHDELERETRPTARIESDPYEAPLSGRGSLIGGITRIR